MACLSETIKKTQKYLRGEKMSPTSVTKIKNIDHLGIVAGLIDEIGIVEIINSKLGTDPREKISLVSRVSKVWEYTPNLSKCLLISWRS